MRDLRDLKDLTLNNVQPIGDEVELPVPCQANHASHAREVTGGLPLSPARGARANTTPQTPNLKIAYAPLPHGVLSSLANRLIYAFRL